MDILAHGMYNIALQGSIEKQTLSKRKLVFWALFWGMLPDFVPFGSALLFSSFTGALDHHALIGGYDIAKLLYPYTHSLVIFLAVFVAMRLWKKKWHLPMLGWGLHIIFDMPLHTPEFFPTPFLFPISNWTLPFGIAWSTPYIWIGSWVAILVWLVILYVRNKTKRS